MGPVIASVAIAVLVAAVVLVIAARMTSDRGEESFVAALRHGLRHDAEGSPMGVFASARRELAESAVADGSGMEDLFRAAATDQAAYLSTDDLVRRRSKARG